VGIKRQAHPASKSNTSGRTHYDDPIVEAAIEQRRQFFEAKKDHLYQIEIFYAILLQGSRSKTGVRAALGQIVRDPAGGIGELKAQFTNNAMKVLLRSQIEQDLGRLDQRVQTFVRQLNDLMRIEVLDQQGQLRFFRRLLNFDDWRIAGKPQSTQFLDYQVVNSNIEAERDHLRVGDHIVRVLTMKEVIAETRPLVLDQLLKIPANFYVQPAQRLLCHSARQLCAEPAQALLVEYQLRGPVFLLYDSRWRETQCTSGRRVSRGARNRKRYAVLPEPAQRGSPAHQK
jgi:hypothetical protein